MISLIFSVKLSHVHCLRVESLVWRGRGGKLHARALLYCIPTYTHFLSHFCSLIQPADLGEGCTCTCTCTGMYVFIAKPVHKSIIILLYYTLVVHNCDVCICSVQGMLYRSLDTCTCMLLVDMLSIGVGDIVIPGIHDRCCDDDINRQLHDICMFYHTVEASHGKNWG